MVEKAKGAPIEKEAASDPALSDRDGSQSSQRSKKRDIPGGFPYLTSPGTLKTVLDKIIDAQRPDKFNPDFLENVLRTKGGTARNTIPILKKMGFLSSDGTPTDLYAKFKTDGGRSAAALQGLRNGFSEIFRRSDYAHVADDAKLRDLIVEITGLQKTDPVSMAIRGTFNTIKSYVRGDISEKTEQTSAGNSNAEEQNDSGSLNGLGVNPKNSPQSGLNLCYNINIVLPETSDLGVLNAIFRSIKENLLK